MGLRNEPLADSGTSSERQAAGHGFAPTAWRKHPIFTTRPWPASRVWRRAAAYHRARRRAARPFSALLGGGGARRRLLRHLRGSAWSLVPLEVRAVVDAAAVTRQEWALLSMVAGSPGGMELATSVPLLAGALAARAHLGCALPRPIRSVAALLRPPDGMARWRGISASLGFDGSRAFVDVLRRAAPGQRFSLQDLRALRRLWQDPIGRERLRHLPLTAPEAIRLLHAARLRGGVGQVHPELLAAAAAAGPWSGIATRFDAALQAWRSLYPQRPLPAWRTPEQLESAMLDLADSLGQRTHLTLPYWWHEDEIPF